MTQPPPAPIFRGTPMRCTANGVYYLALRSGQMVTAYRLRRWWSPWRGSIATAEGAVHVSAWTAQGAVNQLARRACTGRRT